MNEAVFQHVNVGSTKPTVTMLPFPSTRSVLIENSAEVSEAAEVAGKAEQSVGSQAVVSEEHLSVVKELQGEREERIQELTKLKRVVELEEVADSSLLRVRGGEDFFSFSLQVSSASQKLIALSLLESTKCAPSGESPSLENIMSGNVLSVSRSDVNQVLLKLRELFFFIAELIRTPLPLLIPSLSPSCPTATPTPPSSPFKCEVCLKNSISVFHSPVVVVFSCDSNTTFLHECLYG